MVKRITTCKSQSDGNQSPSKRCSKPSFTKEIPHTETRTRNQYGQNLLKLGLVATVENAEWVSRSLIAPRTSPAIYPLITDYRLCNSATVPNVWPMPHINARVKDVRAWTTFGDITFCSGYRKQAVATSC